MHVRYGGHIGRVGALAVALGIGSAVAAPVGIAWAAPDESGSAPTTSSQAESDTDTDASSAPPADDRPKPDTKRSVQRVDDDDIARPRTKRHAVEQDQEAVTNSRSAGRPRTERAVENAQPETGAAGDTAVSVDAAPPSVAAVPPALAAKPVVINPVHAVGGLISRALRPVLSTVLGALPGGAGDSPLAWALLAAARRQVGERPAPDVATSQIVAAAAINLPPTATVIWGRPDATTGTVAGQLVTSDPEGQKVAVKVADVPVAGVLSYNAKTAVFTYTPTTAQRFAASASSGDDTVTFRLDVTDGTKTLPVSVAVPVSPSPFYVTAPITGLGGPSAVAATNNRAYIANRATGTVTIYDTISNTVIRTVNAGGAPDGIAVKPDGTRIYVSSSTGNTVTVIDAATGVTKATIAVTAPTAIAINASGSTVYVASGPGATITKISTSTNRAAGTVKVSTGLTVTELAVSADGKRIYVAGANTAGGGGQVWSFSSTATSAGRVTETASAPTGLALSRYGLYVTDLTGGLTVVDIATGQAATLDIGHPLSGIALTNDGSAAMVTTSTGFVAALNVQGGGILGVTTIGGSPTAVPPGVTLSPDGTRMFVTDRDGGTVHVLALVPPNFAPFSSDPSYAVTNPSTGATTGKVGVVDFDGDPLTYQLITKPAKGKLVLNANGTYTYTPTAAARHAASVPGVGSIDTFTVLVSDGRNGTLTQQITIAIDPANKVPTVTTTIGNPSTATGAVKVTVKTSDGDNDPRTYVVNQPTKGSVTITGTGAYTYTPTSAALSAARAPGATYAAKTDTFTVTVNDGHGGVVPVTVNVKIGAANIKPVWATPTLNSLVPRSGVVAGTINVTDIDSDPLTYTAGKTTKGTVTINPDGSFTYTPTVAARAAASKKGASAATKSETITVTVSDGFGGTVTKTFTVSVAPNPASNLPPLHGAGASTGTSTAIGAVTGVVTADDPDGDALTYSVKTGPAFGTVKVTADGHFTYIPDVDARYRALVTSQQDTDSFEVSIVDGFGGSATATVQVTIAPPAATAIDQRATTVAVNTQQMYFYSQTDTDIALGLLKDAGVGTIRIMLPWAGVEPQDDTYDWAALDRMVTSANAVGIKVLATINATPDWAAVPGQPPYVGAPADLSAFGDFVSEVATRYQGRVADYEIWNEPNYNGFWAPTPDAATYTELLKIAYTAIKSADKDATVIGGSVAAVAETPGGVAVNPVTYLSQMYAAGAAGYFDALAFHPYLYSVAFSAQEGHAGTPFLQAQQLYAVMVANGDGNKKMWATEYGQPASEGGEALQAAYVGDFLRAWRSLEFAGPAFIHTIADYEHEFPDQATMGLFHADWTPKPVVAVVSQVIAENQAINAAAENIL